MKFKKSLLIICLFIFIFAMASVSASDSDNTAMSATEDSSEIDQATDVTCDNDVAVFDEEAVLNASAHNFTELNHEINDNNEPDIYFDHDFTFDNNTDSEFKDGIVINRSVNIFGNNHKIDAAHNARIFNIISGNVYINGVRFVNGYAENGGAITGNSYGVIDCTFTSNKAEYYGGAIFNGYAQNCTFNDNTALNGGAIYNGSAEKCTFVSNNASYGGAIYDTNVTNSQFSFNIALVRSGAMEGGSAYNCTFIRNSALTYGAASKANLTKCYFHYNNASTFGGAIGDGCFADNCNFTYNYAVNEGGAVYASYVNNSRFQFNHANHGGAISGNVNSVENSIFLDNDADDRGGALNNIYAYNCEFRRNHAREGGAMYGSSAKKCTFIANYATDSSGAIKGYSEQCIFFDNSAYSGGACEGDSFNSTFEQNHAVLGGAVYGSFVNDCIFIDNYADEGGAIYGGSAVLCNFTKNSAKVGGAMYGGAAVSSNFTSNVAEISGGAHYRTSLTDCILIDNLPKYVLSVSGFEAINGFGADIHVKLSDSSSNIINNIKTLVQIYDSNNKLAFVSVWLSGETSFVDLDPGEFTIVVSMADPYYNADSVTSHMTIKKASSFYVNSITATYNKKKDFVITLKDSSGKALSGAKVTVNLNGAKTYTTDKNGQIKINVAKLVPKTYTAKITFAGDNSYKASSAEVKVTVKKAKPIIKAKKKTYKATKKVKKFKITLKDNNGKPIKKVKVRLIVQKIKKTSKKKTTKKSKKVKKKNIVKTNKKGKATFKINRNKKGKYLATVKFYGNEYYAKAVKKVKIKIK